MREPRRPVARLLGLGALAAAVVVGASLPVSTAAGPAPPAHGRDPAPHRTFRFRYEGAVDAAPVGAKIRVWLPVPQTEESQTVHRVVLSHPGVTTLAREQAAGNQLAYFEAESTGAPLPFRMEVTATRREDRSSPASLSPEERSRYLQPEPLVPVTGPVLQLARAATVGRQTELERARAIYSRVTRTLRYDKSGEGWGRGDALFACDAKRGNCTDFHALIVGMARASGIPARFAIGFPLPRARGEGSVPGYHCWAELYVRGTGWIPVDSSEAAKARAAGDPAREAYYFGHLDENRLEFSRGRNLTLVPPQHGAPLNYFVYPYVEVDHRPWARVTTRYQFQDLNGGP